jgi:tRNA G10  N-methylase Trm11
MDYLFFGGVPDVSWLELTMLLPVSQLSRRDGYAIYSGELDIAEFAPRLGGIRKIARSVNVVSQADVRAELAFQIEAGEGKNVAVTDYADLHLTESDFMTLKHTVSRPVRFVSLGTGEHELIMLARQHVTEYCLLPMVSEPGSEIAIAETVWIFDAADWIRRDREKPYRDIKRGMLPPKLARMLVNLALQGQSGLTLADPFCGTGTVLSEAALVGCPTLYGSDTNPPAVQGAQANLAWLKQKYDLGDITYTIREADATHLDREISHVDCIVTEPYMGPLLDERSLPPLSKIQNIARGLDKLYRGTFRAWARVLRSGGRVVMTIPSFVVYGRTIPTISVDTLSALGYNYISSVAYGKPGATVIRNITILEKS